VLDIGNLKSDAGRSLERCQPPVSPVNRFAIKLFLNSDMCHRRDWSGAMPMFLGRRNPDYVARPNFLDRAFPALCPATTGAITIKVCPSG